MSTSCIIVLFRVLVIYLMLLSTFVFWKSFIYNIYQPLFKLNEPTVVTKLNDEKVSCKIPKLNPFDPSIVKFVSHPRTLLCKKVQPDITFVDIDGYLRLTDEALKFSNDSTLKFVCHYRTFDRSIGYDDNGIGYDRDTLLTEDPVKLFEDSVEVVCKLNDVNIYHNIHAHPVQREDRIFAKPDDNQLTVLMFYIDSVSYSVLQRNLPSTYEYTKKVMNMIYFESFNKVADNSFPNMIAALTGKRVTDEQEGMMREFEGEYNKMKFDPWPVIWKMYAAKGYATIFNEDMPEWGLFHYLSKGFAKKPVDFYYHTFWMALHRAENDKHSSYCFANEARPRIMLDITKRHLVTMKDKLQFIYTFHTELSHNYVNEVERYDEDLVKFWKHMFEDGYLNKTVVIFSSDHGHRFSNIRSTLTGLLEERLPFFGIWFPDWFYKLHPKIEENLENNSNVLSSTFDIHETLRDVLDANYEGSQRSLNSRGLSQLYALPKNRTCTDAGIPDHYCTCIKETPMNVDHSLAQTGGRYLVKYLNTILTNSTSLCQKIRFKRVMFCRIIDYDEKVKQGVKNYEAARKLEENIETLFNQISTSKIESFRIGIETKPFDAQFEAVLNRNFSGTVIWHVEGTVSRTNSYSGLSDCINDVDLRKYCSCKSVNVS